MDAQYISSKYLAYEVMNEYNIQSLDYIARIPEWIANGIRELDIYQAYVQHKMVGSFGISTIDSISGIVQYDRESVYGFQLPSNYKTMVQLKINGVVASMKGSTCPAENICGEATAITFVRTDDGLSTDESNLNAFNTFMDGFTATASTTDVTYFINRGWIHTSEENGTFELIYRGLPVELDADEGQLYPMIMDNALLKKALKLYILKMILQRGYNHPVLSLASNNPYLNPALELDQIRIRVRVSCNKYSKAERESLANTILR